MIAIIKYNAGNIRSVQNALYRLGKDSIITDDPGEILSAERVILPGVGEAGSAMKYIAERGLDKTIMQVKKPFLGICLGLQLMCKYSEESNTNCLGIFDAGVKKFPPGNIIPHMGWNNLSYIAEHSKLLEGIAQDNDFYFVHSYYAEKGRDTLATCNYILDFGAVMQKDNYYATQFHPEKSSLKGIQILKNFIEL
ncbi:MAG: imidazole glycerol phosphate synthase subunit HisH [Marinilabiliaceae bacterium]|nr:imidazole glycerol phosphate synthase subunit HisH [Marinilabiliaceae bacterium]